MKSAWPYIYPETDKVLKRVDPLLGNGQETTPVAEAADS
jgi:hypothetical protein